MLEEVVIIVQLFGVVVYVLCFVLLLLYYVDMYASMPMPMPVHICISSCCCSSTGCVPRYLSSAADNTA